MGYYDTAFDTSKLTGWNPAVAVGGQFGQSGAVGNAILNYYKTNPITASNPDYQRWASLTGYDDGNADTSLGTFQKLALADAMKSAGYRENTNAGTYNGRKDTDIKSSWDALKTPYNTAGNWIAPTGDAKNTNGLKAGAGNGLDNSIPGIILAGAAAGLGSVFAGGAMDIGGGLSLDSFGNVTGGLFQGGGAGALEGAGLDAAAGDVVGGSGGVDTLTGNGLDTLNANDAGLSSSSDTTAGTQSGTEASTDAGTSSASDTSASTTNASADTGGTTATNTTTPGANVSTNGLTFKEIQDGYRVVNGVKTLANAGSSTSNNSSGGNMSILQDILNLGGAAYANATGADTTGLINAATNSSNLANTITADQWKYYTDNYRPAETAYINRAMQSGSPEEFDRNRGTANADVTGAYDAAGKATANRMQSFGINPGSPAYQASLASGDLSKGAATVGALTTADRNTRARSDAMLQDVSNMGRGVPSAAAASLNSNATTKANLATTGQKLNAANAAATGYGLNSVGNLIGKAGDWFGTNSTPNYNNVASGYNGFSSTADPTYGAANNAGFVSPTADEAADFFYADGGKVDAMDPRSQEAYRRATGDTIDGRGAVQNAAQPSGPAPQGLAREERMAREAKRQAGPTDPNMRRQMGLPPLQTFANGGSVIDAKRTGKGTYDATGLDNVMQKRGINPEMRSQVITPHMKRFADGGGVGRQGLGDDDSDMGMPNDVSQTSQPIEGAGTETSDSIPAQVDGQQPAALSNGEFVMSAPVLKMTGEDILKAINDAGLQRRDAGLDTMQPQDEQAYAEGGEVGADEPQFQQWYAGHAKARSLNPNPDDPQHFYDYRSAYRSGAKPDASGHWPSQFKREGHPRMVIDGMNTKTGEKAYADGGAVQADVRKSDRYRPSEMPQSERHRVGDASVNEFVGKVEKRRADIQHAQRTPFGWDKSKDERERNQQEVESSMNRTLNYLEDKPHQYARGGRVNYGLGA